MAWRVAVWGAGAVCVAGCGGTTGEAAADGGAPDHTSPLHDAGSADGDGGGHEADQASSDTGAEDTGTQGGGCHEVTGTGSSQLCTYTSPSDAGCSDGASPGCCPSKELFGCCIETTTPDSGPKTFTASCYYSPDGGDQALMTCQYELYMGFPYVWDNHCP
jgi:hypothetical protein